MTERNCANCVFREWVMDMWMCRSAFPLKEDENRAENCDNYTPREGKE